MRLRFSVLSLLLIIGSANQSMAQCYTPAGVWGKNGNPETPFYDPREIAVGAGGQVYVLQENSIDEFTNAGAFVKSWVIDPTQPEGSSVTGRFETDAAGNIYVITTSRAVFKFDAAGEPSGIFEWPPIDGLLGISNIAVDGAGKVFLLAHTSTAKFIVMYTAEGDYIGKFGHPTPDNFTLQVVEMVIDSGGNLNVLSRHGTQNALFVFNTNGALVHTFMVPGCAVTNYIVGGVSIDPLAGYYAYRHSGTRGDVCALKFDSSGQLLCSWALELTGAAGDVPRDTAVDASGNVFVLEGNGLVYKYVMAPEPVVPVTWSTVKALLHR
jgi:hypothetical protein